MSVPVLHVCTTCRAGREPVEGQPVAGQILRDEIARALSEHPHPPVEMREVVCLSSCTRGAAAAISAPGKWTYLLGDLTPELIPDLLAYCESYAAAKTGTVLPSRRAETLRHFILGRVPAQGITEEIAA